jgi:hypothetical protein
MKRRAEHGALTVCTWYSNDKPVTVTIPPESYNPKLAIGRAWRVAGRILAESESKFEMATEA